MTRFVPHVGKSRSLGRRVSLAAVLLASTALPIAGWAAPSPAAPTGSQPQPLQLSPQSEQGSAPVNTKEKTQAAMPEQLPSFTHLVAQVKPAVVSVTNYLNQNQGQGSDQGPGARQLPFPFNQFPFNGMVPQQRAVEARGSGFIINPDGLIVTNNHVVKDARRITVTLDDGQTVPARVIGADERTDIALLKIDAHHPLPYLRLGNSDDAQPGEWVIAIGNPFGLSETVTAGIVSAIGRNIGEGPYDQFIQIDAPINEGNSGGPVLTQDGKVIGMDTAILSPNGGSIGIGFAIPSNLIKSIANDLQHYGHVTRGYIGVEAQQVSPAMAKALNLPSAGGALIAAVEPNTPADHAGLQPGDVIRSVDGQNVNSPRDLAVDVAGIHPGDEAHLGVVRNGSEQAITLRVGTLPSQQQMAGNTQSGHQPTGRLGLALGPLTADTAAQLDVPDGTQGAVVTQVQPGSPADQAGIQPGDVIVGVGTHSVHNVGQAASALRDAEHHDNAVALRIIHNGQPAFVAVNPTESSSNG
jgi:serine protease Do